MAIIIRDAYTVGNRWNLIIQGAYGIIRLRGKETVLSAIGHTGYEYFPEYSDRYLRFMLCGRFARVEKIELNQSKDFMALLRDKRLFTVRFRVNYLKSKKKAEKRK